jgi:hypothetical protein
VRGPIQEHHQVRVPIEARLVSFHGDATRQNPPE